jgi:Flp pilus assembly protein protease CpaA
MMFVCAGLDGRTLMELLWSLPFCVVLGVVLLAGVIDARSFRIPNAISLTLLVSGLGYHAVMGGLTGLGASVLGLLFGLGITSVLFLLGVLGAGDVKLMAAVGAWFQLPAALLIFVVAALATGVYSFALLAWQGSLNRAFSTMWILAVQLLTLGRHLAASEQVEFVVLQKDRRRLVPFAVMIALGVIVVLVWATWPDRSSVIR